MKTLEECLDDLQDDDYWYLTCFESINEEKRNDILRRIYHSSERNDASLALDNANTLRNEIDTEAMNEAEKLASRPDPLANHFDEVDAGLERLTIRSAA